MGFTWVKGGQFFWKCYVCNTLLRFDGLKFSSFKMRIYHFIFAIKLFYLPSYGAPQHYLWGLKNFVRLHFFLPCYWDLLSHFWKEFWENYFEHPMVFLLFTLQPSFRILQFATWVKADFENQRNDNNTPTYIKALKVTITTQLILSLFMLTFSKPTIILSPWVPTRNFTKSHPKIPTFLFSHHKQSPNERNKVNSIF